MTSFNLLNGKYTGFSSCFPGFPENMEVFLLVGGSVSVFPAFPGFSRLFPAFPGFSGQHKSHPFVDVCVLGQNKWLTQTLLKDEWGFPGITPVPSGSCFDFP